MKKLKIILILMLFISIATAQKKVAVFDPTDDSNTGYAEIVREVLSTGLTNSKNFKPVERVMIQQVLKENKYQATGLVDENKISKLGKQMGADFVCVSILKKMGDNYFITAKLVNVTTGSVELQQYVKTENGDNDLFKKVEELSKKMFENDIKIKTQNKTTGNSNITNISNNSNIATLNIYRRGGAGAIPINVLVNDKIVGTISRNSTLIYNFQSKGNKYIKFTIFYGFKRDKKSTLGSLSIDVNENKNYYIEIDNRYSFRMQLIPFDNVHRKFKHYFKN